MRTATAALVVAFSGVSCSPAGSPEEATTTSSTASESPSTFSPQPELQDPTPQPPRPRCFDASDHQDPQADSLGAGSKAFPVTASGLIEGTHDVMSRHLSFSPAVVAGFDSAEDRVTYQEEVAIDGDASNGTWGSTVSGNDLYIGMSFDDDERRSSIMKLDHATGELTEAASTYPARLIWDMDTAPDGTVYAATSRQNNAGLWEFDPQTEEAGQLRSLEEENRQDARSVAATEETVYIGLGNAEPDLVAYDRTSGEEQSVLPEGTLRLGLCLCC